MKKIYRGVWPVIFLFCSACVSIIHLKPTIEEKLYPRPGEIETKNIGEVFLSHEILAMYDAVEILVEEEKGRVPLGIYIATRKTQGYLILQPQSSTIDLSQGMVRYRLVLRDDGKLYLGTLETSSVARIKEIPSESYRKTKVIADSSSTFRKSLIYTGKEQNVIKVSYREFSGNFARPVYTVDVTYDLNESNIIAFQSAKLRIVEATNTSITYEVISNFDGYLSK
jgi:hypothetical protein